ncbi:OmpP1/FadL family transporter [Hymenobacter psychrotolerans]|uniref:Long-chain fatty acid transport protein n=1 Tax=Hymenobacter psychrotolerans DSM 18569 TaxID=1121959 RepID=A0A1M6Q6E2_9BACT|nr:outer membrane protein transport protein [Hymenobacter psychrotolerans]SHK15718.1 Long-chain fatty acid transport protein [Hymenobacter psychrotolerans DSM 18569]
MLNSKYAGLLGLTVLGLGAATHSQGQNLGNSPYSRLGLGDTYFNAGGVRQMGMGGTGLAAPNGSQVNELNPALLYYTNRTTWEATAIGEYKTVSNSTTSQKTGSGKLGYLALSVPISSRWGAALGLKPFSSVDFESTEIMRVDNNPNLAQVLNRYKGEGELSEAYFAHGVRLAKGLSVGVAASYVFGSIDMNSSTQVVPDDVLTAGGDIDQTVLIDHIHYSDFKFRGGAHYRSKLSKTLNYNVAGTYSFQTKLNGERLLTLSRQTAVGSQIGENIVLESGEGSATVPALAQFGLSLDNNRSWSASLDVAQQQWSKFRAFNQKGGTVGVPLDDTWRAALGGEFAPDPGSVDSYFKRVTYRAGIAVAQLPYRPGGQVLYDRSVSWGFSFPVSATALDATILNLGFAYGQRGNTDVRELSTGLTERNVKETYIRAQLGVSINNRWFIKRRIE